MHRLIEKDPRNAERIKPYIGGEEVNTCPTHAHHRYAIDFEDFPLRRDALRTTPWAETREEVRREILREGVVSADYPGPVAADWPDLLEIVERRAKPERKGNKRERYVKVWWQYGERRSGMINALLSVENCMVISQNSPHFSLSFSSVKNIAEHTAIVFTENTYSAFAVMQGRLHEVWTASLQQLP